MNDQKRQANILAARLSDHPLLPALESVASGRTTGNAADAVLQRAANALEHSRLNGFANA